MSVLKPEEYIVTLMKTNFLLERPRGESTSRIRSRLRKLKKLLSLAPGEVARITLYHLDELIATFPEETRRALTQFITSHQETVALGNVGIGQKLLQLKGRDLGYMTNEFVRLIYDQLLRIDFYQPSDHIVGVINALLSETPVDSELIRHFVLSYYRNAIEILSPIIGAEKSAELHEQVTLAKDGVFEDFNFFVDNLEVIDPIIEKKLTELRIVGGRRKKTRKRKTKRKSIRTKR